MYISNMNSNVPMRTRYRNKSRHEQDTGTDIATATDGDIEIRQPV